jgi:hypothetical protein
MRALFKRFARDERGVAAIELAAAGTFFILAGMTAVDVGRYGYETSEVNAAAQAGAQASVVACDLTHTPATLLCPTLTGAVTTAIQSTRLGASVQLDGAITEGYYCIDTTGQLQLAGPAAKPPADCSGIPNAAAGVSPALYLQVHVASVFQPLFPGLSIAQTFAPSIKRTAWMRMA